MGKAAVKRPAGKVLGTGQTTGFQGEGAAFGRTQVPEVQESLPHSAACGKAGGTLGGGRGGLVEEANWLVGPCAWSATRRSGRRMGGRGTGGASQSSSRPAGCTGSTWPSRRRRLVLCLLSRPGQVAHDTRGKGFNQKTREKSAEGP